MEKGFKGWKSSHSVATAILTLGLTVLAAMPITAAAQDQSLPLLKPQTDSQPFLQLLAKRASSRSFSNQPLSLQTLSNLLWSAFGMNRLESGGRTAPTANNRQEIDVYAAMEKGIYLYDAKASQLKLVAAGDHRGATGSQPFVKEAALNLVYVADFGKSGGKSEEEKLLYAAAATGCIGENVYLYCASAGLSTVIRASANRSALVEMLKLRPDQKIILVQTVGYPK